MHCLLQTPQLQQQSIVLLPIQQTLYCLDTINQ
jgi:hypothetical protein